MRLVLAFGVALLPVVWTAPHYASPGLALVLLLTIQSIRHLWRCKLWRWPAGGVIAWVAVAMYVVWGMLNFPLAPDVGGSLDDWPVARSMACRPQILSRLSHVEGDDLVIVRYDRGHNVHAEWVYNSADIDRSKVVWAREMDEGSNRELLRYFRDRTAWLLLADHEPPELIPFLRNDADHSETPNSPKIPATREPDASEKKTRGMGNLFHN